MKRRLPLFILLCGLAITRGYGRDDGSAAAIHRLIDTDFHPYALYSLLAQSGAIQTILKQSGAVERTPDVILFYNCVRQINEYCLAEPKTYQQLDSVFQGKTLCVIALDDNTSERYAITVEHKTGYGDWRGSERITSLFTNTSETRSYALTDEPTPGIPFYIVRVEFYRIETPCEIRAEIIPLPGETLPRKYIGLGVGGGFIYQEAANLVFRGDTVTAFPPVENEISANGSLNINVFPGRDIYRTYSAAFWKREFYRDFFRRWSLQAGLAFTRSNQLLQHYSLGAGFRLLGFLDLSATMLFTSRPKEFSTSVLAPADHIRADQVMPQTRHNYLMIGVNINLIEW